MRRIFLDELDKFVMFISEMIAKYIGELEIDLKNDSNDVF